MKTFEELGVSPEIRRAIEEMGYEQPMPVQEEVIPYLLGENNDVVALAQTGTGKTAAFGLPLIQKINVNNRIPQSLILCPTRELCLQIAGDLNDYSKYTDGLRVLPVYGGSSIESQIRALKRGVHIIVATPGRLLDLMERKTVSLATIQNVVMDEADEMLKMGFIRDVRKILNSTPADTQVVMFSATISREVMDVAWEYQHDAVEITVAAEGDNRPMIAQFSLLSSGERRLEDMGRIIDDMGFKRVMVFCNMKNTVRRVHDRLRKQGRSVDCLHGDIPQGQRNQVMNGFREGKFEILVATDVAARGIDVDDVEAVFNYDIPDENEYYLHRIGRTGRAKRCGAAFTFMTPDDRFRLRDIKKYTRSDIRDVAFDAQGHLELEDGTKLSDVLDQLERAQQDE